MMAWEENTIEKILAEQLMGKKKERSHSERKRCIDKELSGRKKGKGH